MLNIIPWYYRAAAILALFAAAIGFGYVKGLHHQKELDDATFAQIRVTQDQQAIHAGNVKADRALTLSAVVDSYEDERSRLLARNAMLLRDASARPAPSALPADQLPKDTDWRAAYSGLVDAYANLGRQWKELDAFYTDIRGRCAETTLMYLKLREAVWKVEKIN